MSPDLRAKITRAAVGGAMGISLVLLPYLEGERNKPYFDVAGIQTVCVGHTGHIEDRTYSPDECRAILNHDLQSAFGEIDRDVKVPLSPKTKAALASFTFNVGRTAFRKSTLLRRINAGEGAAACDELLKWVYAGGRKVAGLLKRRQFERELCIEGFQT